MSQNRDGFTGDDCKPGENKPLRNFSYNAPKESYSENSRLATCWYCLAPVFAFLIIASAGVLFAYSYHRKPLDHISQLTQPTIGIYREDGSIAEDFFLDAYLSAKGISSQNTQSAELDFMGTYARGNELIAFKGYSNLHGEGRLSITAGINQIELTFREGQLLEEVESIQGNDRLAIRSLASFFEDPLLAYALNPDLYVAQIRPQIELGVELISVDLVHSPSARRYTMMVDPVLLQITTMIKETSDGDLTLRLYSYQKRGDIVIPTEISSWNTRGYVLPIELSDVKIKN